MIARLPAHRREQWRMLGLAWVAMFASAPGQSFLIAVFLDEMLAGTGLSRTSFSALYAAATVISAVVIVRVGRATDRFGLRAVWLVVGLSLAIACGVASLAAGLASAFVALALLRTFGQGSFPLVATLIVARFFRSARGRAMAVASFGITSASVFLPPLAAVLIVSLGWRETYRVLAVALVVLVLPLALLIRDEPVRRPGDDDLIAVEHAYPPALRRSRRLPRIEVPTRGAASLLFVLSAPPLIVTAIVFHAVSLLGARGLSVHEAALALGALGAVNAVGTIAAGLVADRATTRVLLAVMAGLFAAGAALLLSSSALAAYAAFVLLGLGGGVFGVASGLVWARTYGTAQIGRLQGTSFAVQIAAAAAGPLPLALALAATGSYAPALAGLALYALVCSVVAARWHAAPAPDTPLTSR